MSIKGIHYTPFEYSSDDTFITPDFDYEKVLSSLNSSPAIPVVSPIEEIRNADQTPYSAPLEDTEVAIIPMYPDIVVTDESSNGRIFKTREEFISTLSAAYEKELRKQGISTDYVKYLVAQDALESNWGKSSLGHYNNYGGIKEVRPGKGVAKPTNEFISGRMEKVSGNFREFASLEEYVKYKVDLLNNSRYRAFSSRPGDFISHVVGGGYATDPEYASKISQTLHSFQKGGKLDLFESLKKEEIEYLTDNKLRLAKAYRDTAKISIPLPDWMIGNQIVNEYAKKIDTMKIVIDDTKVTNGRAGYDPRTNTVYVSKAYANDRDTLAHEIRHSYNHKDNDINVRALEKYIDSVDGNIFMPGEQNKNVDVIELLAEKAKYIKDKPAGYKFTAKDFEEMQKERTKGYTLIAPGEFLGETYEFDAEGKPTNAKPISNKNGEGVVIKNNTTDFSGLGRLNNKALDFIMNQLAQVKLEKKESDIAYAKEGLKLQLPSDIIRHNSNMPSLTNSPYRIPGIDDLAEMTAAYETWIPRTYTLKHKGKMQKLVGYGFADKALVNKYKDKDMPKSEGNAKLKSELTNAYNELTKTFSTFSRLAPETQLALTDLHYNSYGINTFTNKSPKLKKLLVSGNTDPVAYSQQLDHEKTTKGWLGDRSAARRAMAIGEYNWDWNYKDKYGRHLRAPEDRIVSDKDYDNALYKGRY